MPTIITSCTYIQRLITTGKNRQLQVLSKSRLNAKIVSQDINLPLFPSNYADSQFVNADYYSFKIFPRFWLSKSTRIIHNNQLLMTKFGRILCLARKWRQKNLRNRSPRRPGDEVELFWLWKQKWRIFHSFQERELGVIIAKNLVRTARRQLEGRQLLFGGYLQSWTTLNVHFRRWT